MFSSYYFQAVVVSDTPPSLAVHGSLDPTNKSPRTHSGTAQACNKCRVTKAKVTSQRNSRPIRTYYILRVLTHSQSRQRSAPFRGRRVHCARTPVQSVSGTPSTSKTHRARDARRSLPLQILVRRRRRRSSSTGLVHTRCSTCGVPPGHGKVT